MTAGKGSGMTDHDFAKQVRETLGAETNENALTALWAATEELETLRAAAVEQGMPEQLPQDGSDLAQTDRNPLEAPPEVVSTDPNDAPAPKIVNPADLPAE